MHQDSEDDSAEHSWREGLLQRQPWIAFVLPMVIFSAIGALEATEPTGTKLFGLIGYDSYPIVYTVKIALTVLALGFAWPAYQMFPRRISLLAVVVGVVGVVLWIGLAELDLERTLPLAWLTGQGNRAAYNPFDSFVDRPMLAYAFLAVRFFGLTVVVALAEEMFLRGFLIRYVEDAERWNRLPIGQAGWTALLAGTVFPMLAHPGELIAAMVWFSVVSWLMMRTRSIWDCITAHIVTNLLLGLYVVWFERWDLW
jgi:CAAX protease family protein